MQASAFFERCPVSEVSRYVYRPGLLRLRFNERNLIGRSVAAIVGLFRDFARLRLAPSPPTDPGPSAAGAIEGVFLQRALDGGYEVGAIAVRRAGDEVARETVRTFHAMTNPLHNGFQGRSLLKRQSQLRTQSGQQQYPLDEFQA